MHFDTPACKERAVFWNQPVHISRFIPTFSELLGQTHTITVCLRQFIHICWRSYKLVFHPASKAEAAGKALKTRKAAWKGAEHRVIESSSPAAHSLCSRLFSLASVPLINSWLSSVTNVSLPSSSPGEEGGVFNVQFVLWIDVCWHRLSPRLHRA